ncbi:hypothetical protein [Nocardia carnea]|uniref:Uncharacterized protein n=1 Tax=Nocardia carnea TaxID=37328 RepID=A0ABW7TE96_9NOCA|nr:hypothetical protein [Nocardia carnea]
MTGAPLGVEVVPAPGGPARLHEHIGAQGQDMAVILGQIDEFDG